METLLLVVLVAGVIALVIAVLSLRRGRPELAEDSYYGPLPEDEVENAEATDRERYDPTRFGQVTPGAVTPPAAGTPEQFYAATGVGRGGPEHLSGPPPVAETGATRSHPSGSSWTNDPAWGSDG